MTEGADVSDKVTRGRFPQGMRHSVSTISLIRTSTRRSAICTMWRPAPSWTTVASRRGEDIPLDGGTFGDRPVASEDYIQGRFVGDGHAGVVGVFERSDIVGSFGASRQSGE